MITFLLFIPLLAGAAEGQRKDGCRIGQEVHPINTRFIYKEGCYKKTCYCLSYSDQPKLLCPEQYKRYICAAERDSPTHSRSVADSAVTVERKRTNVEGYEVTVERKLETSRGSGSRNTDSRRQPQRTTEDATTPGYSIKKSHRKKSGHEKKTRTPKQNGVARRGNGRAQKDPRSHCTACVVNNREYPGHSRFRYRDGCQQFHCVCKCDGSWNCPAKYTRDVCESTATDSRPQCKRCQVKGREYEGSTYFNLKDGCVEYRGCTCACDGKWKCYEDRTVNVCKEEKVTNQTNGCRECNVYGTSYPGHSRFTYSQGCLQFLCDCKCDGTWECPKERTTEICSQNCRNCLVDSETLKGNTTTKTRVGCFEHTCNCSCDGQYQCGPGTYVCDPSERYRACKTCVDNKGLVRKGNTSFIKTENCDEFACSCNCRGQITCKRTKDICAGTGPATESVCKPCTDWNSEEHEGNSTFVIKRGHCHEYHCRCDCDGTYECPSAKIKNICQRPEECRSCRVNNKDYATNTSFGLERGCRLYTCKCQCSGTYSCDSTKWQDTCANKTKPAESTTASTCKQCNLLGNTYEGNTNFKLKRGCYEFPCKCDCMGRWQCFRERVKYICDEGPKTDTQEQCKRCIINGTEYVGNTRFKRDRDCYRYTCTCNCDGSWDCPASTAVQICRKDKPDRRPETCRPCIVNGTENPAKSRYYQERNCYRYTCQCKCDGTSDCPADTAKYICGNTQSPVERCQRCNINGTEYAGNTDFQRDIGCFRYTCSCRCDGSWECPGSKAVPNNSCRDDTTKCRSCIANNQEYKADTRFYFERDCKRYKCKCNCDGSFDCPVNDAVTICDKESSSTGNTQCRQCQLEGRTYRPHENFQYDHDCFRYQCQCYCNGTIDCPGSTAVNICPDKCIDCDINGTKYRTQSDFQLEKDCLRYKCKCNCDGSWLCPGKDTKNICPDKCVDCDVNGTVYRSESSFQLDHDCHRYSCNCRCNGSWDCPGSSAVNICPHKCYQCDVNGTTHEPNSRFQLDKDCYRYQCTCNCDGSWECPGDRASYICSRPTLPPVGGCRQCEFKGNLFAANTDFNVQDGCLAYSCRCSCSGESKCRISNICAGTRNDSSTSCTQCRVDGERYNGDTNFQRTQNCRQYDCRCHCDGRWTCDAATARYICGTGDKDGCRRCSVQGTWYAARSRFLVREGCFQYTCECQCDGRASCPQNTATDICRDEENRPATRCKSCRLNEQEFPGNSMFEYVIGCYKYECECDCNGRHVCPQDKALYICGSDRNEHKPASTDYSDNRGCRSCSHDGKRYPGGQAFMYQDRCFQFTCYCKCDGSYQCPAHLTKNKCKPGTDDNRRPGGTDLAGCSQCVIHGQALAPRRTFIMRKGCMEHLCECKCDGTWTCPEDRSVNICETRGFTNSNQHGPSYKTKGCRSGDKTHYTRLFAKTEGCIRYMCVCHESGHFTCPESSATKVC